MRDLFDFRRKQELEGAYWLGFVTGLLVIALILWIAG